MIQINTSVISYFWRASPVVKIVMMLLLSASFVSWYLIFQRRLILKEAEARFKEFEKTFWAAKDLMLLYQNIDNKPYQTGFDAIFLAGVREFKRLQTCKQSIGGESLIASLQRSMRNAHVRVSEELEEGLNMLATIGSTSPYVGLFGTVWGIMTAFQALGHVSQATIAMVAPGISEALVATAMGLFAAIPAVIAFNRYQARVDQLLTRYESFQDVLAGFLAQLKL